MQTRSKWIRWSLTCALLFCASLAHAKPVAQKTIDAIETTYRDLHSLTATFSQQTKIKLLERTVTRTGTLELGRAGAFRIAYDGEGAPSYVSDGKHLWIVERGRPRPVETFLVGSGTLPREALAFLQGFESLHKLFTIRASTAFGKTGKKSSALHLTPRKHSAHYTSLDALFNAEHLLERLIIHTTSGNTSTYRFTKITRNAPLSKNHFTPKTY